MLTSKEDDCTIKVIDWGTSRKFNPSKRMKRLVGTVRFFNCVCNNIFQPYYIAPEVLKNRYDEKCDIWSIGVITFIILSGIPPFNGASDQEIMKKVKLGKFNFNDPAWKGISDNCKDFITKLLTLDQNKRPSADEALKHPWLESATLAQK